MKAGEGKQLIVPLALAPEGALVEIVGVSGGRGLVRRLAEMGLSAGALVRVVNASRPGPVVVELLRNKSDVSASDRRHIRGWKIILGVGVARKVLVRVLS
ncbi:MAG: ferrous iron transport protein A [Thermoprotei archaeon]|nr:MAG: ferrous iron transport protein A [Thermoprotei archaeon]RLF24771.1 MAG: ferrous iron transport protein A [Thermoprotei archaeon]